MEKITKSLTIGLTENNQCAVSISPETTLTEALQLVGTLTTHILEAYTEVATSSLNSQRTEHANQKINKDIDIAIKGIKDSIYDAVNQMFSNILQNYQPEHPRYSLEDEAIIELTNSKIQEAYNKLTSEQKNTYSQTYQKMKNNLEFRKRTAKAEEEDSDVQQESKKD